MIVPSFAVHPLTGRLYIDQLQPQIYLPAFVFRGTACLHFQQSVPNSLCALYFGLAAVISAPQLKHRAVIYSGTYPQLEQYGNRSFVSINQTALFAVFSSFTFNSPYLPCQLLFYVVIKLCISRILPVCV